MGVGAGRRTLEAGYTCRVRVSFAPRREGARFRTAGRARGSVFRRPRKRRRRFDLFTNSKHTGPVRWRTVCRARALVHCLLAPLVLAETLPTPAAATLSARRDAYLRGPRAVG